MHRFMGYVFALLAAMIVAQARGPALAGEPADSVRAVIVSQLDAMQADDPVAAFAHASPTIQSKFGTPEGFRHMVETGYPMIWRPARYEMLALAETAAGLAQTVLFQDREGRLYEAAYEMQLIDGVWRINGVSLRALPGIGR